MKSREKQKNFVKNSLSLFTEYTAEIHPIYDSKYEINLANVIFCENDIFIAFGPTPASRDGEYRPCLINLKQCCYETPVNKKSAELLFSKSSIITPLSCSETICIISKILEYVKKYSETQNFGFLTKGYFEYFLPFLRNCEIKSDFRFFMSRNNSTTETGMTTLGYVDTLGCKFVPLSIYDLNNINNIKSAFQIEIKINDITTALKVLCICPNFSQLYGFIIINCENKPIFNSTFIKNRYKDTEKYKKIIGKFKEIYCNISDSEYEEILKEKVTDAMTFAEKNIVLSNYNCLLISSNVGISLCNYVESNLSLLRNLRDIKIISFQVIYALHCLHYYNIIHGDLHLGNIILSKDKQNYTYKIKDNNYSFLYHKVCVVDMGRVILGSKFFKKSKLNEYESLQKKKLLYLFNKTLPEFYLENRSNIDEFLKSNFDDAFLLYASLDIINFSRNLRSFAIREIGEDCNSFLVNLELKCITYIRKKITEKKNINLITWKIFDEFFVDLLSSDIFDNYSEFCDASETDISSLNYLTITEYKNKNLQNLIIRLKNKN